MGSTSSERVLEDIPTGLSVGDDMAIEEEEEELEDTIPFLADAKAIKPEDEEFPVVHVLHAGELKV